MSGPAAFTAPSFNTTTSVSSSTMTPYSTTTFICIKNSSDFSNFFNVALTPTGYIYQLNSVDGTNVVDQLKDLDFSQIKNINNVTVAEDFESYLAGELFYTSQLSDVISNLPAYDVSLNITMKNSFASTITNIDSSYNQTYSYTDANGTTFTFPDSNFMDNTMTTNNIIHEIFGNSHSIFIDDRLGGELNDFEPANTNNNYNFQSLPFISGDTITFELKLILNNLPSGWDSYTGDKNTTLNSSNVSSNVQKTYTVVFALN